MSCTEPVARIHPTSLFRDVVFPESNPPSKEDTYIYIYICICNTYIYIYIYIHMGVSFFLCFDGVPRPHLNFRAYNHAEFFAETVEFPNAHFV